MADHPRLLQTVIDSTDIRSTAEFYRQLLGLRYRPGDEAPSDRHVRRRLAGAERQQRRQQVGVPAG